MRSSGLLGWALFAVVVYSVWNMRVEMDPQQEALKRTTDMVAAMYPGAEVIQQVSVPAQGRGDAAALVVFSEAGGQRQRSVYVDYSVKCEDPNPACIMRERTIWDSEDPEFFAQVAARSAYY